MSDGTANMARILQRKRKALSRNEFKEKRKENNMRKSNLIITTLLALCMILSITPAFAAKSSTDTKAAAEITSQAISKIDINSADVETLAQLPGIGQKTAEKIISYRKTNGQFKNIDDLLNVKGIGQKKLDKMKAFITLS